MLLTLQPGQVDATHRATGVTRKARRWARSQTTVVVEPTVTRFTWANRRPGTDGFARWAGQLGQCIEERGLAAAAADVENLICTARDHSVALVAAEVLADPNQPEPARLRAFAAVVSALVATPATATS